MAGLVKHEFAKRRGVDGAIADILERLDGYEVEIAQLWTKTSGVEQSLVAYADLASEVSKLNRKVNGETLSQKLGR